MKPNIIKVILLCAALSGLVAAVDVSKLAVGQITFEVKDENSMPMPSVKIGIGTEIGWEPGQGFGKDIVKQTDGSTNEIGVISLSSPSHLGYFGYSAKSPAGFYCDQGGEIKLTGPKDGKWQPWNPTVNIVLKRIIKPIPMYARMVEIELPLADEPIGYDLVEADWVAPHGRGKVGDFVFKLTKRVVSYKDYGAELQITFLNKQDGIQGFNAPPKKGSQLRSPHHAPEQGYEPSMSLRQGSSEQGSYGFNKEDQNYLFRVRTVVDEKGKIVSALYGKVYGQLRYFPVDYKTAKLRFVYYLNPTINDRNIEFDPARNLFTGSGSTVEVVLP